MNDAPTPSASGEYRPLLAAGFHHFTPGELRQLCVGAFPQSSVRSTLMDNLETAIARLDSQGIPGEVWVDGSFLTEKIEPGDVDLVLKTSATFLDTATQDQQDAIEWLNVERWDEMGLDAYFFYEWPAERQAMHALGVAEEISSRVVDQWCW